MNIPEIAKCGWCNSPARERFDLMFWTCSNDKCPIAYHWMSAEAWNRRQPTPEAADLYKRLCQAQRCPNCPDQGWYAVGQGDNVEQCQCQFCYETPDSLFNVVESVKAHPPKPEPTEEMAEHGFFEELSRAQNPQPPAEWMEAAAADLEHEMLVDKHCRAEVVAILAKHFQHAPRCRREINEH